MLKVSRRQTAQPAPCVLPLTYTPGGRQRAGAPPPGLLSNEPFQGHTVLQGISGTVEFPGPCSHLSLPTSAWSAPSNSPTAWYCTHCDSPLARVRVMRCELGQLMASAEGPTRKQRKPAVLPKDSCPRSSPPAPPSMPGRKGFRKLLKRQVQSQVLGCHAHRFHWR